MLDPTRKLALYAEATMGQLNAKMTEGIIRYGRNPVVAVIDSHVAGKRVRDVCKLDSDVPIVATLDEAIALGADVFVLGTAPSGGRVPPEWMAVLQAAVDAGMSLVNGLHDPLSPVFGHDLKRGQWIWDIRTPIGEIPPIATARAARLPNTRVLMVGTDMAIGKMTAGLEIYRVLRARGTDAAFLATGQIGVSIMGTGIPLDAYRVDHASGAVERMVMEAAGHDVVIIEGQGSLLHPGSTATLPLMRGSCCNAMILCHRAGMEYLDTFNDVRIPPLRNVIELNEMTASANHVLTDAKVVGIALNTRDLSENDARREIARTQRETGLSVTDPVRFGAGLLADCIV
ncbi:MAG: DUF1611 domain-containing protein [Rhodobacter sp.]|nr:DUF1611 domain-containing protein [Rhodobacter sp.]